MSIINQLEKTVTPAILGNSDDKNTVAYVGLLEQFYALLAARLALPQVYSHIMRTDEGVTSDISVESPLFEQLWQDQAVQRLIIQELADTHHIDLLTTSQLLINAAPLAYRELKILADGQFLPAFLQTEQTALRQYLPIWSAPAIAAPQISNSDSYQKRGVDVATVPVSEASLAAIKASNIDQEAVATSTASYVESASYLEDADKERTTDNLVANMDGIHVNPSAHHWGDNSSMKREKVRTRNQRNDLLVRVFLLIIAIAGIGLAAWALLIKPNNTPPLEPVAAEPVVAAPLEVPAQVMTPVELIVGVDNSGSLYTCSATVGNEALQATLQQALNTSFGEQASTCELTIKAGVATDIATIPPQVLPNIFTTLRSTPFARLQLQNDRLILEAPDSMLLQKMVADIQALAPTMLIDSTAPLPLPNNSSDGAAINNMAGMNGANMQFENGDIAPNSQFNNNYNGSGSGEYQASDDNTGDRVTPVLPAPNNGSFNNNNNVPADIPSNIPRNTPTNTTPNRSSGPISPEEADDMANSVIVVEPAQVR